MIRATSLLLLAVMLGNCAHLGTSAKDCAAQVTPALEQTAAAALMGQDYEAAIARDLGGLAACLVVAAVKAAIEEAGKTKAAGAGAADDQAAIERHGDAWMRAHGHG